MIHLKSVKRNRQTVFYYCVTQKRGNMTIYKFANEIQDKISERLGTDYQVRIQKVQKNNGVHLQGLVISSSTQNISPTFYLDDYFEAYCNGYAMERIIESILHIYRENTPKGHIDMSFFKDFQMIKNKICYRLVNAKQNQELLEKVPHILFLDLAICFYYAFENEELGSGTILIYHTHLKMWNATTEELFALAQKNTPRIFSWECSSMQKVMEELMNEELEFGEGTLFEMQENEPFYRDVPMQILSNRTRTFGAACILYPGVLEQLSSKFESDFYILPSSIHEVILLFDSKSESPQELKKMIAEVNRTQVQVQEVLSNSLYYYSAKQKQIKIL